MTKFEHEVIRAAEFLAREWTDPKAVNPDRVLRTWFLILAVGRLKQSRKRHKKRTQAVEAKCPRRLVIVKPQPVVRNQV
jgi:hypothetical protein